MSKQNLHSLLDDTFINSHVLWKKNKYNIIENQIIITIAIILLSSNQADF